MTHPREGSVAAIYHGTLSRDHDPTKYCSLSSVRIEIVECYNTVDQHIGYHYHPIDLTSAASRLETKTIGAMSFDRMVAFAQEQFPWLTWHRVR